MSLGAVPVAPLRGCVACCVLLFDIFFFKGLPNLVHVWWHRGSKTCNFSIAPLGSKSGRKEASAAACKLHTSYKQKDMSSFGVRPQEPKKGGKASWSMITTGHVEITFFFPMLISNVYFQCLFLMLIFDVDFQCCFLTMIFNVFSELHFSDYIFQNILNNYWNIIENYTQALMHDATNLRSTVISFSRKVT